MVGVLYGLSVGGRVAASESKCCFYKVGSPQRLEALKKGLSPTGGRS